MIIQTTQQKIDAFNREITTLDNRLLYTVDPEQAAQLRDAIHDLEMQILPLLVQKAIERNVTEK